MKIEKGISANCSEATIRFRTDKLTKEEEEKLFAVLEEYVEKYNYETYIFGDKIFGIRCITVDGDAPYNDADGLKGAIKDLPFINKVKSEMEEE
jgi:hypothetical protein